MIKNIDSKKIELIEKIAAIDSVGELNRIIELVKGAGKDDLHEQIFKAPHKNISVEQLKKEQNYQGIDREEFDALVSEIDIKEPIEYLLKMLD